MCLIYIHLAISYVIQTTLWCILYNYYDVVTGDKLAGSRVPILDYDAVATCTRANSFYTVFTRLWIKRCFVRLHLIKMDPCRLELQASISTSRADLSGGARPRFDSQRQMGSRCQTGADQFLSLIF